VALDVRGIVKNWINTRTDLVGHGKPVSRGAFLKLQRAQGTYLYVTVVGTPPDLTAETPVARARVSVIAYGSTMLASSNAAVAYATVLESLTGKPEKMGDYRCLVVDNLSLPLPLDDHLTDREEFRHQVDADFWITT